MVFPARVTIAIGRRVDLPIQWYTEVSGQGREALTCWGNVIFEPHRSQTSPPLDS